MLPNSKERPGTRKWIPLLEKERWPCHQKNNPFRIGTAGVVVRKSRCSMRFETWCVSDHPSLFREGNPFFRARSLSFELGNTPASPEFCAVKRVSPVGAKDPQRFFRPYGA